ncbi:nucleotide exchange factor GrpE [Gammaproteobacteria bacterium AB-CW1]|uniref:Protein GrpE n=1 Tax=Natronospira elongata TaxID=3110268 RepID=A0AAP6JFT4_9GAMM|nr:nucleotide exchange factor GrpE [Gammaproteobacteria bacterium AB-CW1]
MAEEQSHAREEERDPVTAENAADDEGRQAGPADLEAELAEAREALENAKADNLRTLAELENVRKRARRDVENARKFAIEKLAAELLDVKDSLEMGLKAVEGDNPSLEQLREGKEMTLRQLITAMEKVGIAELNPEGEPFNPEFHEAMTMQESAEHEPDSVIHVIQKGYLLNGRLLRPARVIVARSPEGDADGDSGEGA